MSEHTPHRHDPVRPVEPGTGRDDQTLIDLVAGDPPVPITVWRTARTEADLRRSIPARLAYRLVAAYSRPGEAVVDLTDDHALAEVCAAGRRAHHRAWFTDHSSLLIAPATEPPSHTAAVARGADEDEPDVGVDDAPDLADWFGDDLTDPDLTASAEAVAPPPDGSLHRAISLVVARWPLDEGDTANRVRLAWLLAACAQMLRPGGCLVLVVTVPVDMHATPEDFSPLVAAAGRVGLGYLQHIVAVTADVDGDAFVYHVTDDELATLAHASAEQWSVAHLRVHADLLVFAPIDPPSSGPQRRGGGARG